MKKYRVPIFTEEYAVWVYIGTVKECVKEGAKYTTYSPTTLAREFDGRRGLAYNLFTSVNKNPLVLVDGDLPVPTAIATLTHEAIHAIDFTMEHLGIDTKETEFRAHAVGAIMRTVLKDILKKSK